METYKKTPGNANMKGELYEVYVSMMLFLHSTFRKDKFKLAVNMSDAGAFDDIVLWLRDNTYFFQLKHKATKPIIPQALCAMKGDFSLIKYFCSYLEVKRNFSCHKPKFIIYTNTKMKGTNFEYSEGYDMINSEGKIYTIPNQSEEYKVFQQFEYYKDIVHRVLQEKFDEEEIKNRFKKYEELPPFKTLMRLINNKDKFEEEARKQIEEWNWNSWDEFIMSLKFYTEQSSVENLEVLLRRDLEKFCGTPKIFNSFKEEMLQWWSNKKGYYLNEKCFSFWKRILQSHLSDLMGTIQFKIAELSGMKFKNTENLPSTGRITHVICRPDSTPLSCLRIQQAFINTEYLLTDINVLRERLSEVLFFWYHYHTLIIDTSSNEVFTTGSSSDEEIITQVSTFMHLYQDKRLIFVSDNPDPIAIQLSKTFPNDTQIDDFNLSHMTQETQENVMNCKVTFQGNSVELKTLVHDLVVVTADVAMNLLRRKNTEIGCKIPAESAIYIPRKLSRYEIVQEVMFNEPGSDCFVFTGLSLSELRQLLPHNTTVSKFDQFDKINTNCKHFIINSTSSFKDICQMYKSVHWIQKIGKSFAWKCSYGNIAFIIDNVDRNSTPVEYSSILEVINISSSLVLLVAEPGMGKSTEMDYLARVLKKENPSTWVVKINLIDHTNILARNDINVVDLLCTASGFQTEFERELFHHEIHHQGKVVVLMDGYDEISPNYSQKVFKIVHEIISKKIKICLTSRPNMRSMLEMEFCSLAFSLEPFSYADQINFMNRFWNIENNVHETTLFAKKVLEWTSICLNEDIIIIAGIPLLTKMLSEVFKHSVKEYVTSGQECMPTELDILQLYTHFVDGKCQVYLEKDKSDETKVHVLQRNELLKEIIQQHHEFCALVAFLSEEEFVSLHNSRKLKKRYHNLLDIIKEGKEKTGLIVEIINNKPTFLHRTFMEFFVAHWVSQNYKPNQHFILRKMFDQEWQTVRAFMDRILCVDFILHTAVLNQNLSTVQYLLDSTNTSVNEQDDGGRTPLHLAVLAQNKEKHGVLQQILNILIAHGADSNIEDDLCGWTPLHLAEKVKSWFAVDILLEHGASKKDLDLITNIHEYQNIGDLLHLSICQGMKHIIDSVLQSGLDVNYMLHYPKHIHNCMCTLLQIASREGKLDIVKLLVNHGADLEIRDAIHKRTPFLWACHGSNLEVVKFLADNGSQTEILDGKMNNALILASMSGNVDLVAFLVCSGLDINAKNKFNRTAIFTAAELNHWDIVEFLITCNADFTFDRHGWSLVSCAIRCNSRDNVARLLDMGIILNNVNNKLITYIHAAAYYERWEILKLLLERGANEMLHSNEGCTLLHYTAMHDNIDILYLVLNLGLNVNETNCKMQTPAHIAACYKKWENVKNLLEHRTDYMAYDNNGNTLLHHAASHNAVDIINLLLHRGANVNVRNMNMQTPAHKAIYFKSWEAIEHLLTTDIDHMVCDNDGNTLLHYASQHGAVDIIIKLLDKGIDVDARNKKLQTPAHIAANYRKSNAVKILLELGADFKACDSDGNTLLHYAAKHNDTHIMIQLLDREINVNVRNNELQTAAHKAAVYGKSEAVKLLLGNNADHMACDSNGNTLLHLVAKYDATDIIIHLLELGANINTCNRQLQTPAHVAAYYRKWKSVKLLLQPDADLMTSDNVGNTVLHYAAMHGATDIIHLLLVLGVNLNVRNNQMQTPAHIAAYFNRWEVVKLLIQYDADHRACDKNTNTLLHLAARHGATDIIIMLLDKGMNVDVRNKSLQTPAHRAANYNRWETVKYLLDHGADPKVSDNYGNTLLHYAAKHSARNIINQLLDLGMGINVRNKKKQTPVLTAAYFKRWKAVNLLLECGADHMTFDNDGNTLLHYAAKFDATDIIMKLLNKGVNGNVKNRKMQTPTHIAAYHGKSESVKLLLQHDAGRKYSDCYGNTILHYATRYHDRDFITMLLDQGIDINARNKNNQTPAHLATFYEGWLSLKLLLEHGADHMACDKDNNTLLHYAAMYVAIDFTIQLIDMGVNINSRNISMQTPAHIAAKCKRWENVKYLLEHGADHMASDSEGNTLLHYAAMHGATAIIIQLLNLRTNVNAKNKSMQTSAHKAVIFKKWETVKLLLGHGADHMASDSKGNTLLHYAAKHDSKDMIIQLLDLGINVNSKNKCKQTPAHMAICCKGLETVKLLLENGADHNACDSDGYTLLHYAAKKGDEKIIIQLLDLEMNIDIRSNRMQTPAHLAVYYKRLNAVKLLLQYGADLLACDCDGNTLVHYSAMHDSSDIIKLLLDLGINVNVRNKNEQTPACIARNHRRPKVVELLLEHGAQL